MASRPPDARVRSTPPMPEATRAKRGPLRPTPEEWAALDDLLYRWSGKSLIPNTAVVDRSMSEEEVLFGDSLLSQLLGVRPFGYRGRLSEGNPDIDRGMEEFGRAIVELLLGGGSRTSRGRNEFQRIDPMILNGARDKNA